MKKRNKALLVLLALVLVTGLGAKMYSNITMGDNEWIGLGASAGRIAFDDEAIDEVIVRDARLAIGTGVATAQLEIWHDVYNSSANPHLKLDYNNFNFASFYMNGGWDLVIETTNSGSDIRLLTPVNRDVLFLPGAGGNVGVKGADPSYDLDVAGDLRATNDVLANKTVFIGSNEDGDEDGDYMTLRADTSDGGWVNWTRSDFTGAVYIFDADGNVGPEMVIRVQWLVHDDTTGNYTNGDAILINGPHAQDNITIAGTAHVNELSLHFYGDDVILQTVGTAGYYYDVALLMMWVED